MKPEIYILGVGHNTALTIELAEACGYRVAGLYHYCEGLTGQMVCGVEVMGTHDNLLSEPNLQGRNFALSMGDNDIRASLFYRIKKKGGFLPPLVHPTCVISRFAEIGEGSQLEAYCVVHANSCIGENCNLQPYVLVCHNSTIGKHSFLAAKSIVGAYITVEHNAFIGMSAVLVSSKAELIGHHSIIGAGAVLTQNAEPSSTMVGVPAKLLKRK